MIRQITAAETLPLRSLVLRNGLPPQDCTMEHDQDADTFHLGYFNAQQELVCILTCMRQDHPKLPKEAFRLRGMATHPNSRRQGLAAQLLQQAQQRLQQQQVVYLWFNARTIALPFYEALGFEYMSEEFDIPGVGPHREMFKYL